MTIYNFCTYKTLPIGLLHKTNENVSNPLVFLVSLIIVLTTQMCLKCVGKVFEV